MAEKVKILKKDNPFLKKDLELKADVVEKLTKLQEERQKKFQSKIEATQKEALGRYTAHIKALEEAKAQAVERYSDEIKRYRELVRKCQKTSEEAKIRKEETKKTAN
ncbi:MAG: hypothetical protein ACYSWZ_00690 [Planctomycetota bacterium]|jgi:hypothetical protein